MPVKRRTTKHAAHRVTDAVAAAFSAAIATRDKYYDCVRGPECDAPAPGERCQSCRAHIEAKQALSIALRWKLWLPLPSDVHGETPPDWMTRPDEREGWALAWAVRQDIEAFIQEGRA